MKRYWLFIYDTFYPSGGMQDFRGSFDSKSECAEVFENQDYSNYEIFDSKDNVIVESNFLPTFKDVHEDSFFDLSRLAQLYPKKLWNEN